MALVYCARSTWRLASSGRFASICLVISSRGPFRKSGTGSAGGVGMLGEATAVRTARRGEGARAALRAARGGGAGGHRARGGDGVGGHVNGRGATRSNAATECARRYDDGARDDVPNR